MYYVNFLGIVGHNAKFGCRKCMLGGTFYSSVRHMSFPRIITSDLERQTELRTNENFRNRSQPAHHLAKSELEALPIDMVKDFTTSDSLHLLDLGVMKRYIQILRNFLLLNMNETFKLLLLLQTCGSNQCSLIYCLGLD